jgi:major membrane immunogen (membrane-anchored lipoprotein)
MKQRTALAIVFFLLILLVACSAPYRMTLKDGTVIEMSGEPEFDKHTGFYEFTTVDGKSARVNKDEVVEIKEL